MIAHEVFFFAYQAQKDPLENPPIKAVCRATSAAPTYFPPVHFTLTDVSVEPNETREFNLIDGGVVVNNPVRALLLMMHQLYVLIHATVKLTSMFVVNPIS